MTFRDVLLASGLDRMLAAGSGGKRHTDPPALDAAAPEQLQTLARLFCLGEAVETERAEAQGLRGVLPVLEAFGLVRYDAGLVSSGYRLVCHLGLLLFCEPVSASARFYYGDDSLALSEMLSGAGGNVLDLCAGVGAQSLVCARTATSVMAVELEPLAEPLFCINAELNGLAGKVEYLIGNLFEPVAGRRFDLICCNPPFMPVPPGVPFPRFADGGPDGLAIVGRLLRGLPEALAPGGCCHIVGAVLGDDERPQLSPFDAWAAEASLAIDISGLYWEPVDAAMLASCAETAAGGDVADAFRIHFAGLGATRIYYFLLTATRAAVPNVYYADGEVQRVSVG